MNSSLKFIFLILCVVLVACDCKEPASTSSVGAVDAGPDTTENRKAAVDRYLAVVPVSEVVDDISEKMSAQMPPEQGVTMKKIIRDSMDAGVIEKAMRESMAKHFSVGEITALSNFYSTAEGKSVMKKMGNYMAEVMPVIQQQIAQAATKGGAGGASPAAPK